MKKLIILDRDGVINYDSHDYIKSPEEWLPIPEALKAIAKLSDAGFTIAVATNQSGIARGYYTEKTLADIHAKMHAAVAAAGGKIDSIFYCPHGPNEGCRCRKPKPGLLLNIAEHYNIKLSEQVPFIGDTRRDCEAALFAGCKPILVTTGHDQTLIEKNLEFFRTIDCHPDLMSVANSLCLWLAKKT